MLVSHAGDNLVVMVKQPYLLLAEDDIRLAAALRRALTYERFEVSVAVDGPAALAAVEDRQPDLLVLDVMLPGLDGFEVCRRIREDSKTPILMLTARDAVPDRVRGLNAGADDYLVKPFALEELVARIRALLRRSSADADPMTVLSFLDLSVDLDARLVTRGGRDVVLTSLEFDLLTYFLRHPRRVLSRDQLLAGVWGDDADPTSNIVDVYVGYLRQKTEAAGESRLLHTMRGVGYVLREA